MDEAEAESLLQRTYEFLTILRTFTHPNLWDGKGVQLYLEIEAHLNQPATGTIRDPRQQDIIDRRRRRLQVVAPTAS